MKRHFLAAVFLSLAALPLRAQIPDARLMPAGALRWAFTPSWKSWDRVLDVNGNERLLTSLASSDSAGADLFSALAPAESAVRSITGNPSYRLTMGALKTALDADARRFPLDFAVGLGNRVTLTAGIPIVVTRMNAVLALDSTTGAAGVNQPGLVTPVLSQLNAAATSLSARISAGTATCAQPGAVLSRAQALAANLSALAGVGAAVTPAAAPTRTSVAGKAIARVIATLYADLGTCGTPVANAADSMPLPTARMSATDIQSILTTPGLGYETDPFVYTKFTGLGDADVGLRIGVVQATHARFVLFGGARLPIGTRDTPENLLDIAPADHQLDVTGGFEAALEPGSAIGLSVAGSYTRQFADNLERRVVPVDRIINNGAILPVNRDLGDELSLSVFPGIRLNDAFRVYAGGTYYKKGADRYTGAPNADSLGVRTAVQATSFTGGIQYRSMGIAAKLPIEAGLTYSAVYTGQGGFVPKATTLTMYLRFYYRLWGGKTNAVPG